MNETIAYSSPWTVGQKWRFLPVLRPYQLSSEETGKLLELSRLVNSLYVRASVVMGEAARTGEPSGLHRAIFSCFHGESAAVELAKEAIRKSSGMTPRIVRLDVLGDMRVCEYQVPGTAWGPVSALEALYGTFGQRDVIN
jgi:hypothetical protein